MRTAKTLIRLGGCPGWSESSLGAHSFCWFCHEAAHVIYAFCLWTAPLLCLQKNRKFSEIQYRILWLLKENGVFLTFVKVCSTHVYCSKLENLKMWLFVLFSNELFLSFTVDRMPKLYFKLQSSPNSFSVWKCLKKKERKKEEKKNDEVYRPVL